MGRKRHQAEAITSRKKSEIASELVQRMVNRLWSQENGMQEIADDILSMLIEKMPPETSSRLLLDLPEGQLQRILAGIPAEQLYKVLEDDKANE